MSRKHRSPVSEPVDEQPAAEVPDIADAPDLDAAFESVYEPEAPAVEPVVEPASVPVVEPIVEAPAPAPEPAFSGEVGSGLYRDNSGLARSGQVSEGSVNFASMAERAREAASQESSQETA